MGLLEELLPKYRCHKVVSAAKIVEIGEEPRRVRSYAQSLMVEVTIPKTDAHPSGVTRFWVEPVEGYFGKHRPEVGGYFVVYEDGYQSFSPAKAFEEGYALLEER